MFGNQICGQVQQGFPIWAQSLGDIRLPLKLLVRRGASGQRVRPRVPYPGYMRYPQEQLVDGSVKRDGLKDPGQRLPQ